MRAYHWQGQGQPCDVTSVFTETTPCGSVNGLGGDLIGARNVTLAYHMIKTSMRKDFESLVAPFADPTPAAGPSDSLRRSGEEHLRLHRRAEHREQAV